MRDAEWREKTIEHVIELLMQEAGTNLRIE